MTETMFYDRLISALNDIARTQKQILDIQKKIVKEMEFSNGRTEFREDDFGCD